jgi:hypothetical protein
MAGEHGRGFAVVADEIRLLAERSTESTKRIETLVKSIQGDTYEAVVAMEDSTQEVVKGSQLADEAGRSLNTIYSAVERQAKMIENIARAAHEQRSVSEAVAIAMAQILEITRQTDAGTQEATVSVSYLAELAEQLRSSVATFRLPDHTNALADPFSSGLAAGLPDSNSGQVLPQSLFSGTPNLMDSDWRQSQAVNLPPLPESGNADPLVALSSRPSEHYPFGQQDFASWPVFPAPPTGSQPHRNQQYPGNQQHYQPGLSAPHVQGHAPNLGSQQNLPGGPYSSNQQDFGGGQGGQQYSNQQDVGDMASFESQQGLGRSGQSAAFGQHHGSLSPRAEQVPFSPMLPIPSGQPTNWRLRRPPGHGQNPSPFNQDQNPFPDNG